MKRLAYVGVEVTFTGGFSSAATITATSPKGTAYGIKAEDDDPVDVGFFSSGNMAATINAIGNNATGIYTDGTLSITGNLAGTITAKDYPTYAGTTATGIYSRGNMTVDGTTSTAITATTKNGAAIGIKAPAKDIKFTGEVSSNITATSSSGDATGITAENVYFDNGFSGTINVTAGYGKEAIGIDAGKISKSNGARAVIGGTITATAQDGTAHAISSDNGMNLEITGTLEGASTSIHGSGVANDKIMLNTGATLNTAADLGGGTEDTLTLLGTGTLTKEFENTEIFAVNTNETWTLSGENQSFATSATIQSGTLIVNNFVNSPTITVGNGTTLGGTGTLVGAVDSYGTVAPGNSIGTLTIKGDYTQSAHATLAIEIADDGTNDKLEVSGTATLDGTLHIQPQAGAYSDGDSYTIITAGTRAGEFATVTVDEVNSEVLEFDIAYSTQEVTITVKRTSTYEEVVKQYEATMQNAGKNSPVVAMGAYMDRVANNATGDMANIIGQLNFMSAPEMAQAFSQMLPNNTQAAQQTNIHVGSLFTSSTNEHLFTMRGAARALAGGQRASLSQRPMLAQGQSYEIAPTGFSGLNSGDAYQQSMERPWNVYARYIGNFGQMDRDDWGNKTSWQANGVDAGLDLLLTPNIIVGANFGFTNSVINVDNVTNQNSYINSYRAGVYGTYFDQLGPGEWYVDASLGYALNSNNLRRGIRFTGVDRVAKADFLSHAFLSHLGAGYEFKWKGLSAGPIASLDFMNLWNPEYTEYGAQDLNLTIKSNTQQSLQSGLGVRLAYTFEDLTPLGYVTPEIRAEWRHEYLNDNQELTASMQGNPYGTFSVTGPSVDRDTARLGTGFTASLGRYVEMKALYEADISKNAISHGVNAMLQVNF